jgi:divalent metal cation (Fe/Co/Zn/Cd) transporter
MFDVMTNIIGLVAALLANYFEGWIDPVGAIIVSGFPSFSVVFFIKIALLFHL